MNKIKIKFEKELNRKWFKEHSENCKSNQVEYFPEDGFWRCSECLILLRDENC